MAAREGLAIVAIAGKIFGNTSIEAYWNRLIGRFAHSEPNKSYFWHTNTPHIPSQQSTSVPFRNLLNQQDIFAPGNGDLKTLWEALERAGYTGKRPAGRIAVFGKLETAVQPLLQEKLFAIRPAQFVPSTAQTPQISELLESFPAELRSIALASWYLENNFCDIAIAGDAPALVLKKYDVAKANDDTILAVISALGIRTGESAITISESQNATHSSEKRLAEFSHNLPEQSLVYVEMPKSGDLLHRSWQNRRANSAELPLWEDLPVHTQIKNKDAESTNYVAQLTKLVLTVHQRMVPPGIWIREMNPLINSDIEKFRDNPEPRAWLGLGCERRGGAVFAVGDCTLQLEITEHSPEPAGTPRPWQLMTFSGETPADLQRQMIAFQAFFRDHQHLELADIAFSLQTGRPFSRFRAAILAQDTGECAGILSEKQSGKRMSGAVAKNATETAFLFPGHGSAYLAMAQELYESEPFFAERMDEYAKIIADQTGTDICDMLFPNPADFENAFAKFNNFENSQPALLAIELALTELWRCWGVKPKVLIGHDLGELSAAVVGGVFSAKNALTLAIIRGKIFDRAKKGVIISAGISESAAADFLEKGCEIAAIHSDRLISFICTKTVGKQLCRKLKHANIWHKQLPGEYPVVGSISPKQLQQLQAVLEKMQLRAPKIPIISAVSGNELSHAEATNPAYWVTQTVAVVQFSRAIKQLADRQIYSTLEVGPGHTLGAFAKQSDLDIATFSSLESLLERCGDTLCVLRTLAKLWINGAAIDWDIFYEGESRRRLHLPVVQPDWLNALSQHLRDSSIL